MACTIEAIGSIGEDLGHHRTPCGYEPPALRGVVVFLAAPRAGLPALLLAPPSPFFWPRDALGCRLAAARRRSSAPWAARRRRRPPRPPSSRPRPSWDRTRCRPARSAPPRRRRRGGGRAQDAGVAAGPLREARREVVEQLRDDVLVEEVAHHQAARRERTPLGSFGRHAALGDGDQPLDERPQFLGLGHGRLDPLVAEQRLGLVAQQRDAMLGTRPSLRCATR